MLKQIGIAVIIAVLAIGFLYVSLTLLKNSTRRGK